MLVSDRLDAVRADLPGCVLIAYGDARSHLILRVSTENRWPQEQLDALCRQGAGSFDGPEAQVVAKLSGLEKTGPMTSAILMTPQDTRVFSRVTGDDADMVCCVCRGQVDPNETIKAAETVLHDILGG